jgi:MFS family permease
LLVGLLCIGVGAGGMLPAFVALLGDIAPMDDVGKVGGVYNLFGNIGATAGPVVGLTAGSAVDYDTLCLLYAGIVFLALFEPASEDPVTVSQ